MRYFAQIICFFIFTVASAVVFANDAPVHTDLININTATAGELADALPGIGPAKSQAIVQYRERNGPFSSVDALVNVKGIGPATLKKIRALLLPQQSQEQTSSRVRSVTKVVSRDVADTLSKQERKTRRAIKAALTVANRKTTKK